MEELIGKKITAILVAPGEEAIVFETDKGRVCYQTEGDCCSETWFADIVGTDALIGGTVRQVDEIPCHEVDDGRTRQDSDAVYGYCIHTDKGSANIVYRNSSNGFYGGCMHHVEHMDVTPAWYSVTDDWSA